MNINQNFDKWFSSRGDETVMLDHNINENSHVIEIGGFKGVWVKQIVDKYKKDDKRKFVSQKKIDLNNNTLITIWKNLDIKQENELGYFTFSDGTKVDRPAGDSQAGTTVSASNVVRCRCYLFPVENPKNKKSDKL